MTVYTTTEPQHQSVLCKPYAYRTTLQTSRRFPKIVRIRTADGKVQGLAYAFRKQGAIGWRKTKRVVV